MGDELNFELPANLQETLIDAVKQYASLNESDQYVGLIEKMEDNVIAVCKPYVLTLPRHSLLGAVSFWKHALMDDYTDEPDEYVNEGLLEKWASVLGRLQYLECLLTRCLSEDRGLIFVERR